MYPRLAREELGGISLGRLNYLEAKAEGDNTMSGRRWPSGGIQGGGPQDPRDTAKAGLLEAQPAGMVKSHWSSNAPGRGTDAELRHRLLIHSRDGHTIVVFGTHLDIGKSVYSRAHRSTPAPTATIGA